MRCLRIVLSFLAIFCSLAWAQNATPDLFTARVEITARTDDARAASFREGLKQVYMKLAAVNDIKPYGELVRSLDRATDWVERFQYQQSGDRTFMLIRFNENLVKETLQSADVPYSEEPRPLLVVWIAMPVQNTLVFLTENQIAPEALVVKQALLDASARWSIPIEMPRGDMHEAMSPNNLQQTSDDTMKEASGHYSQDGYIAVSLSGKDPDWEVLWRTAVRDEKGNGTEKGTLAAAFDDIFWVADKASAQGGERSGAVTAPLSSNEVTLIVSHVGDLESYMRIDAYLNTLPGVARVDTESMEIPSVTFRMTLKSQTSNWKAGLASERVLALDSDIPEDAPDNTFYYHYVAP